MSKQRMRRPILAAALAVPALLAGCGGDDAVEGGTPIEDGADADPQAVIDTTFANEAEVTSGYIKVSFEASGEGADGSGAASFTLEGPFDSGDDPAEIPSLDLAATLNADGGGESIDFSGGLTTTPDAAFITYNDQAYEVDATTFGFVKSAFAQSAEAQEGAEEEDSAALLEEFGVDPSTWLTNVTNEGIEDVGGTDTVHISGDADVGQILDDFSALSQAAPLGGGVVTPTLPSEEELAQVEESVSEASIDVYSGVDDGVLRKLDVTLAIEPSEDVAEDAGFSTGQLSFSIELTGLNEDQDIETPDDALPLSDLTDDLGLDLGGLGALGGLGGTGGTEIPDVGETEIPDIGSGEIPEIDSEELDCISQATTLEELEECSAGG